MSKSLTNSVVLISEKIFSLFIGLFVTALVARYFGPREYGMLNQSLALVTLLSAFSILGLDHILVKKIVKIENEENENKYVFNALILRLVGGFFLTFILLILIILFREVLVENVSLTYIFAVMYILKSFEVYEYWFHSKQKMLEITLFRIISYSLSAIFKVSVIYFEASIEVFAIAYLIDPLIFSILIYQLYRLKYKKKQIKIKNKIDYQALKELFSESKILLISGILIGLYSKLDLIMLGILSSEIKEVGYYAAAMQISSMWYFIPLAIITANKSSIMQRNEGAFLVKTLEYIILISISAGVFISVAAEQIVFLLFGDQFEGAILPMVILAWVGLFATIGTLRSIYFISNGNLNSNLIFTILALILNVVLNLFLIPKFGAYGAAYASLLSQISSLLIFPILLNKSVSFLFIIIEALKFKNISTDVLRYFRIMRRK